MSHVAYALPLFHFCFPLLPSNLSSHLLTQLATSYMLCKELYGSNVQHLVIPHDHRSCKGLRRSNVLLRGYQRLSVCTPPEYIRAPARPARRTSLVVQFQPTRHRAVPLHHQTPLCSFLSSLEFLNTIVCPRSSVLSYILSCRHVQVRASRFQGAVPLHP